MVEKQDMDSCSVLGGQQMILTGQNFSSDSKVIFMEKTQGEWPRIIPSITRCGWDQTHPLASNKVLFCRFLPTFR